jgi:hypothetical protein
MRAWAFVVAALVGTGCRGPEPTSPPFIEEPACDGGTCNAVCGSSGCRPASLTRSRFTLELRGPGTELNHLVAHEGALFATMSTWNNVDLAQPALVWRKDGPGQPWVVDFEFPRSERAAVTRAEFMGRFSFTTLQDGTPLPTPRNLLVVGTGQQSADPQRFPFQQLVWVRQGPGRWTSNSLGAVIPRACDADLKPSVRSMALHRERGVDQLYVGTGGGYLYRGGLLASDELRFEPSSLFSGAGRVVSMIATPEGLYFSVSLKPECPHLPQGLFLLSGDAIEPVSGWPGGGRPGTEDSCRGLTVLSHSTHPGQTVIGCGLEDPGLVVTWSRAMGRLSGEPTLELDLNAFMSWSPASAFRIGPYNEFAPMTDPLTVEPLHVAGLYMRRAQEPDVGWFLIRHANATYETVKVPSVDGRALRGVRTIAPSPWPEERGVFYLGGFDAHCPTAQPCHAGTAWLLRGEVVP